MCIIFLLFFVFWGTVLPAADYYADSIAGNDSADGTTPETAWKSLDRVNRAEILPGDRLFLRRGGLWRGHLVCRPGSETLPIYYGAFGEGRTPIILGGYSLADSKFWIPPAEPESRIWKTSPEIQMSENVGNIILTPKGKLPTNIVQIYSDDTNRKAAWKRWKIDDLKNQDDFFYDNSTKQIFYYSEKNPAELYDEIETAPNGVLISAASFITIENIAVGYGGGHGIAGSPARGVTIRNCDLFWIGGSELTGYSTPNTRYGNGIEFWNRGEDHLVENCRFREIYDTAMTIQGPSEAVYRNIVWKNNLVRRCEQSFEIWLSHPDSEIQLMIFEGNHCFDAGYGWSHEQRPDKNGTHLLGYSLKSKTLNVTIRNNIFSSARNGLVMYWNNRIGELNIDENKWFQPDADGIPGIKRPLFIWGLSSEEKHYASFEEYRKLTGNDQNSLFLKSPPPFNSETADSKNRFSETNP